MKTRFAAPILAALTLAAAGIAFAQSGTAPSGTPAPKSVQPGSGSKPSGSHAAAETPKIIAISFYADWCAGCKVLGPKLEEASSIVADQPCLMVVLDQTDEHSKQAQYMLAALGLGDLWKEHAGKTGFVLLVDTETNEVVDTITYTQRVEDIKAALAAAMKA